AHGWVEECRSEGTARLGEYMTNFDNKAASVRRGSAVPPESYGLPLPMQFQRITQVLNAGGTIWILAMLLLINADVLSREILSAPLRGVTEFVAISITGIVFLQLADTFVSGRITRADIFLTRVNRGAPRAAALLHAVYHTACAALVALILHASWQPLLESI